MQNPEDAVDALVDSLVKSETLRVGLRELRDGEVVYVADSPSTAELLGRTPAETCGRTATELGLPPAVVAGCKAMVDRAIATGGIATGSLALDSPAGPRELACTVVPVPGARPRQLVFVEEARRGEPMFAALVHELGNPLFAVTANLELIERRLRGGVGGDDLAPAIADARLAAEHACDVLATMRALAYPDEGAKVAPLGAVIAAAIALVAGDPGDGRGPAIEVDGEIPDVAVIAGRSAARQIVVNLVRNAVQASARGGGGAVQVSARVDGAAAIVEVVDDGPGLDPALAGRVFGPFVSGRDQGTGLGLFVSRALAERIGARVELHDRGDGGRGARARLILRTR